MIRKLQFVFAFLLVLGCQSVYTKMTMFPGDILITIFCMLTLLILCVVQLEEKKTVFNKYRLTKIVINCMFMNGLIVLVFVINAFFPYGNISQMNNIKNNAMILGLLVVIFDLIYSYFSLKGSNKKYFIKDIINSVFVINFFSLIFYILGPTLKILSPTNTVNIIWGLSKNIASFYNVFFVAQPGAYSILTQGRNTGLFVEGPMYAFVIVVAILFELFLLTNKKKIRLLVGLIALITTYSTTGLIVTTIAILFYIFDNFEKEKGKIKLAILGLIPGMLLFVTFFILKLLDEKMNMGYSDDIRISNFNNAIHNWASRPLVGYGFKAESTGNFTGHTSVFSQVIQDGGLLFLLYYSLPFIGVTGYFLKKRIYGYVFFILCYLLLIFNTVVTYTTFSIAILAFLTAFEIDGKGGFI